MEHDLLTRAMEAGAAYREAMNHVRFACAAFRMGFSASSLPDNARAAIERERDVAESRAAFAFQATQEAARAAHVTFAEVAL